MLPIPFCFAAVPLRLQGFAAVFYPKTEESQERKANSDEVPNEGEKPPSVQDEGDYGPCDVDSYEDDECEDYRRNLTRLLHASCEGSVGVLLRHHRPRG